METNDIPTIHFPEPDREFDFSEAIADKPENALDGFGGWTLDAFADNGFSATVYGWPSSACAAAALADAGAVRA